jgi:ferrochelatase
MENEHVLLLGHGTVENLDDLPRFLANIRHGRPVPASLLEEVRRRYDFIGGSPLLRISRELAEKLAREIARPVHVAMRFWHPFAADVLQQVSRTGATALDIVPLAPFSADLYAAEMRRLAGEQQRRGLAPPTMRFAPSWGLEPRLIESFADELLQVLEGLDPARRAGAHVFFTAHSLPVSVVQKGDRYPDQVKSTAEAVCARANLGNPKRLVYQSQGASEGAWLGPGIRESLLEVAALGARDVVLCPLGFLSDHVEILYDLDVEAKEWAHAAGIELRRTRSLNASDGLVRALAGVVRGCESALSKLGP